jgi:hypothetical protein
VDFIALCAMANEVRKWEDEDDDDVNDDYCKFSLID